MESGQTQIFRRVFEAKGRVEITSPVPRTKPQRYSTEIVPFRGFVAGENEQEQRANFKYYRTIYGDKGRREEMRDIEKEGRIKLLDFQIIQELGLRNGN